MINKSIVINGVRQTLIVEGEVTLANVLRGQLHLTGTKIGCGKAQCGACSVIMDGKVVRSCVTKMKRVPDEAEIMTIEGVGTQKNTTSLAIGMDDPWWSPMWFLQSWLHRFCQRAVG